MGYRGHRLGHCAIVCLLALAMSTATASASTATPLTPAQADALVSRADLPRAQENGGYFSSGPVQIATCRGLGMPRKGAYVAFGCSVKQGRSMAPAVSFQAWARVTPTGLCTTSVASAVCSTPYVANDPRICSGRGVDYCLETSAVMAMRRKAGTATMVYQGPTSCTPAGAFRFSCKAGDTPFTVLWRSSAWLVTPASA